MKYLILLCCIIGTHAFGFSHEMKCRVSAVTGKMNIIGENSSKPGKIRVGDIARFDTSLDQMYLHPGHKLITFENYKGEIAQIYSCTFIDKLTDTDDIVYYEDNGSEGMSLFLQRIPEKEEFIGHIQSKRINYEGIIRLECVVSD